jgi:hypothetical protein
MFFQFEIFLTWQFLLRKIWKNSANSKKNVNNKTLAKKLELEIWKKKNVTPNSSKNLKLILIIPTLNT